MGAVKVTHSCGTGWYQVLRQCRYRRRPCTLRPSPGNCLSWATPRRARARVSSGGLWVRMSQRRSSIAVSASSTRANGFSSLNGSLPCRCLPLGARVGVADAVEQGHHVVGVGALDRAGQQRPRERAFVRCVCSAKQQRLTACSASRRRSSDVDEGPPGSCSKVHGPTRSV